MKLLEERIRTHGKIREGGVLKVDSFLNHQMDVKLFQEMGKEFLRLFGDCGVTKILTIEASGIGIACVTAQFFDCPVIFAKKNKTRNIAGDVYTSKVESFTHGKVYDIIVSKEFLHPEDRVLLIDDFLANGSALQGLINLVQDAGATLVGAGICVEKAFQPGGDLIRGMGVRVESLARIKAMSVEGGWSSAEPTAPAAASRRGGPCGRPPGGRRKESEEKSGGGRLRRMNRGLTVRRGASGLLSYTARPAAAGGGRPSVMSG